MVTIQEKELNKDEMRPYQDAAAIREITGLRPMPEFEAWLEKMGIMRSGKLTEAAGDLTVFLDGSR